MMYYIESRRPDQIYWVREGIQHAASAKRAKDIARKILKLPRLVGVRALHNGYHPQSVQKIVSVPTVKKYKKRKEGV